ncbi:MAG: AAA family ATPase [Candidatus Bathyarchaeota archaeon]|jgi:dephospho-CoA kinase
MVKLILGIAGMPGAGKATINRMAKQRGFTVVMMGDEIRKETTKRGLPPTPENIGKIMLQLREEEGPAVVARKCVPKIEKVRKNIVFVDGIRSPHEVEEYRRHFPNFILIAVHSSPETRFQRLSQRKRSDDPKGWETFSKRDSRELEVGLGNVIATANHLIVNEGTKEEFKTRIKGVLEVALKKWIT